VVNQAHPCSGVSHTWNDNGSLEDDGTYEYVYDYRNQIVLVKLSGGATVATYRYDALGRRVEKDLGSNDEERYVYSGLETIETYNAYDTQKQSFVFGQGIDQVVMLEQADVLDFDGDRDTSETTRSFYHRNALGSVMEITDMNEAEVVSFRYDPYGPVTITVGGTPQGTDPLGQYWTFTGRFHDEETGLYASIPPYRPEVGAYIGRGSFSQLTRVRPDADERRTTYSLASYGNSAGGACKSCWLRPIPREPWQDLELEALAVLVFSPELESRLKTCQYYLTLCKLGDPYGCEAWHICMGQLGTPSNPISAYSWPMGRWEAFGARLGYNKVNWIGTNAAWDDCVRKCLIGFDKTWCSRSSGFTMCRLNAHRFCYLWCHERTGSPLPQGVVNGLNAWANSVHTRYGTWGGRAPDWIK
jgi:YD repeat-containing protein